MKTHLVIDSKGNWQLLKSEQTSAYAHDNDYEIYRLDNFIFKFVKLAVKTSIILWIVIHINNFTNNNLRLAFLLLMLLELERIIRIGK